MEGVEIDQRAAEVARSKFGLRVHCGTLEGVCDRLSGSYDVVSLYHVLEHVLDPLPFLERVRGLLAPLGLVVLRTPNSASVAARCARGWWEWCAAPEHVELYSPRSLRTILGRADLETIHLSTRRGDGRATLLEVGHAAARRTRRKLLSSRRAPEASHNVAELQPSQRRWFGVATALAKTLSLPKLPIT